MALTCFKADDARGRIGVNFDADIAPRIAQAFGGVTGARGVVLARDAPGFEFLVEPVWQAAVEIGVLVQCGTVRA